MQAVSPQRRRNRAIANVPLTLSLLFNHSSLAPRQNNGTTTSTSVSHPVQLALLVVPRRGPRPEAASRGQSLEVSESSSAAEETTESSLSTV